jgi:hypothetical protein
MQEVDDEFVNDVSAGVPSATRLVAVTVRLDAELYEVLKVAGVRRRMSNQAILVEALKAWLAGRR